MQSPATLALAVAALAAPVSTASAQESPVDLEVTTFSDPSLTPCPACLTVDPHGHVYVGVDLDGSLKVEPGKGRILRLIDTDGDGVADENTVYAEIAHPRGLIADGDKLYVLHSIYDGDTIATVDLSVLTDADGDGVADGAPETLISGVSSIQQNNNRGVDHSTNGIALGIDGWIYIAVGDFGYVDATDRDGTSLTLWDGGILRVRTDGTEMELYTRGMRNIYDVAPDPFLNLYTLGNTNDGGGWWVRFTHHIQNGEYGYPRLYQNFTEEIIPAVEAYGTGSGTGAVYLDEPSWPEPLRGNPLMADWTRNQLAVHVIEPDGPTVADEEIVFHQVTQPTDLAVDGSGRLYVAAWDAAGYKGNPDKGFVQQLVPKDWTFEPFPDLSAVDSERLVPGLNSPSLIARETCQRELLRRDARDVAPAVLALVEDDELSLKSRVIALFTYKQLLGPDSHEDLKRLAADAPIVREWALRALTDRDTQLDGLVVDDFLPYLQDPNPRVQVVAINCLSRLGDPAAADHLIALAVPPPVRELVPRRGGRGPEMVGPHDVSYPEVIVPHLAINALIELEAIEPALAAIGGPSTDGVLRVLQAFHRRPVIVGLFEAYGAHTDNLELQAKIVSTLARLAAREADFDGSVWWGTQPDTRGPYYTPTAWEMTPTILAFLDQLKATTDDQGRQRLAAVEGRYRLAELKPEDAPESDVVEEELDEGSILVGDSSIEDLIVYVGNHEGDLERGREILGQQACGACHALFPGDPQRTIDLTQIGARLDQDQITESIIMPEAAIAEDWVDITLTDGTALQTTLVSRDDSQVQVRNMAGVEATYPLDQVESIERAGATIMTPHLVDNLTLEELNHLVDYLAAQGADEAEDS